MKLHLNHYLRTLLVSASVLGGLGAVQQAHACSPEPYMSSICTMAASRDFNAGFGNIYLPASGQLLGVSQYSALFALLGTTYGGNGQSNFQLPDLRGRVIVGAGAALGKNFAVGQMGGEYAVTITNNQLPAHVHALTPATVTTGIGSLAAATTLTGLTGTVSGSSFTLNASDGGTLSSTPSGNALATPPTTTRIYSDAAPSVAMKAGSIGGSATIAFSGNPSTTLTGAPTVSGTTSPVGNNLPIETMPPYLAMYTYIAVSGIFPSSN